MKILADASLPGLEQAFPKPFQLTLYHQAEELPSLLADKDVLLCRANLKINQHLLENFSLGYVATASSGTDHLDIDWLKNRGIQILDTKGANASAVADYVIASLAYLQKNHLLQGNKAGIIGVGHVGSQVTKRLKAAQFQLSFYDPLKAQEDTLFTGGSLQDLYDADLLCIHAALHNTPPFPSFHLINHAFLQRLKPGCVIINAARGGIVDEEALLAYPHLIYCTDVYAHEPQIDSRIIEHATICTPHIAGHSVEAKYEAVARISNNLHQIAGWHPPQFSKPPVQQIIELKPQENWAESILKIYNPNFETQALKKALDKKNVFIQLRKQHRNRHDFSIFSP